MKNYSMIARLAMTFAMVAVVAAPLSCAGNGKEAVKKAATKETSVDKKLDGSAIAAAPKGEKPAEKKAEKPEPVVLELYAPAPKLDLKDVDGKAITDADFKGRAYVIAFWSEKCAVCFEQMKLIQAEIKSKKYDMSLIAVSPGREAADRKKEAQMLKDKGVDAIGAFDNEFKTTMGYQLNGVPYFGLVDKKRRLQAAGRLFVNNKLYKLTLLDMMEKVMKGENVPACEFAPQGPEENYKKMIGKDAPVIKGKTMVDGKDESTLFYKGFSKVLAVFWSPGCPHCRAELPRLERFYKKYANDRNIKIIGFASQPEDMDKKAAAQTVDLIRNLGVTFPNVPDYGNKFYDLYGVQGVPSMFFIGEDGKIKEALSGEMLFTSEGLNCVLDRLDGKGKSK